MPALRVAVDTHGRLGHAHGQGGGGVSPRRAGMQTAAPVSRTVILGPPGYLRISGDAAPHRGVIADRSPPRSPGSPGSRRSPLSRSSSPGVSGGNSWDLVTLGSPSQTTRSSYPGGLSPATPRGVSGEVQSAMGAEGPRAADLSAAAASGSPMGARGVVSPSVARTWSAFAVERVGGGQRGGVGGSGTPSR